MPLSAPVEVISTREAMRRLLSYLSHPFLVLRFGTVESMPIDEVELLWRVNQLGCWLGMQAVVPTMKANGGGSIINASSTEGLGGMANTVAYGATKFAIRGMTKGASHELAGRRGGAAKSGTQRLAPEVHRGRQGRHGDRHLEDDQRRPGSPELHRRPARREVL